MIDWTTQQEMISIAMEKIPRIFGLKEFPGDEFRISRSASYVNDSGVVQLYTERWMESTKSWASFCKGTPEEIRAQISWEL